MCLEFYAFFEVSLRFWIKFYVEFELHIGIKVELCWKHFEISDLESLRILLCPHKRKAGISTNILENDFLFDEVSDPTVATLNTFRPVTLTSLPLSSDGHLDDPIASNQNKLILIVVESRGSEPD